MNKEHIHTLIIPDVHGRTFWKDALVEFPKESFQDLSIVFLGDYIDPYDFEGITKKDAIKNFEEIIEIAKEDKRIHLLIGNHDMHYWFDAHFKCRYDRNNSHKIKDLFLQNFTLFNIAYEEKIDDVKYLYTHAGVTSFWLMHLKTIGKRCLERNKETRKDLLGNVHKKLSDERIPFCTMLVNMTPTADELNQMKLDWQGQALLWDISWLRGGDSDIGSCIWADFEEWTYKNSNIPNMWQIFGHSLGSGGFDEGIIDYQKCIAMLDSRQAWVIDYEGEIKKLKEICVEQ